MTHDQGDGVVSTITGGLLALVAHTASWVDAAHWLGEVVQLVVFGFIGGAAGYGGKKLMERLTTRQPKEPKREQ